VLRVKEITQSGTGDIRLMGLVGAAWGIAGFLMLLGFVIFQLTTPAMEAFSHPLVWYHWPALAGVISFFLYIKGYRAFQRELSRRVVARALILRAKPDILKVLLAPLYCMGFFGAGLRRQLTMICLTLVMVGFILVFNRIDQPWRGIVDFGLVVSFAWGFIATVIHILVP
jgi:hypothetical protein